MYTVLCFSNFVNATRQKPADYWTEVLDRIGDKIFVGISKSSCFVITTLRAPWLESRSVRLVCS
jgi:hypothetical protein